MRNRLCMLSILVLGCGSVRGFPAPWAKVGLGSGIPYGGLGLGAEAGVSRLAIVGGAGALAREAGWSAGGRVYVLSPARSWRPHATLVYGTTLSYKIRIYDRHEERVIEVREGTLLGLGMYLGADNRLFHRGGLVLTYGLGYLTHGELPAELRPKDVGSPLKVLLGLGWRFGA
jgi:hypothetical protein